jgi:arabinose-5-phosphate isomerase
MTAICDDDMNIIGIFTDGDLRRVFDTGVDMRNASIADVMTPGGSASVPARWPWMR